MAVMWIEGRPLASTCKVKSIDPPQITTQELDFLDLEYPRPITLLWTSEGRMIRSESNVNSADPSEDRVTLNIDFVHVEPLDRRRHDRIPTEAPIALRELDDVDNSEPILLFQGSSKDVSAGGAWINLEAAPEVGTMVEFIARPAGLKTVKLLGVIAHIGDGGVGVAFIEPEQGNNEALSEWLNQVA